MAEFKGSIKEFHRFIGPRMRNVVQSITKGYRKDIGKCEHCSVVTELQAAHVHTKDRQTLILQALDGYIENELISVDLSLFENRFKELHYPLDEVFKILCQKCHKDYDKSSLSNSLSKNPTFKSDVPLKNGSKVLPIILNPSEQEIFKKELLEKRKAQIEIIYSDGQKAMSLWDATNINEKSNVIGNLRSRPDFRQGNWQKKGIDKVLVSILDN
jgi:5-methylcytosine-specific restriction endonuclease McrA